MARAGDVSMGLLDGRGISGETVAGLLTCLQERVSSQKLDCPAVKLKSLLCFFVSKFCQVASVESFGEQLSLNFYNTLH